MRVHAVVLLVLVAAMPVAHVSAVAIVSVSGKQIVAPHTPAHARGSASLDGPGTLTCTMAAEGTVFTAAYIKNTGRSLAYTSGFGLFPFTGVAPGSMEFACVAEDEAGNVSDPMVSAPFSIGAHAAVLSVRRA